MPSSIAATISASTCSPPRPPLITIGPPPSAPSRASLREKRQGENAARLGGERQQADEDVGAGEEAVEPIGAVKVSIPVIVFGRRLQPATWKPRRTSTSAASRPRTPRPMMPTRTSAAAGWRSSCQRRSALEPVIDPLPAMMHEDLQRDPFGHALRQVGADHAHDRDVRQVVLEDEVVDPGAEGKDRREIGQGGEHAARAASTTSA